MAVVILIILSLSLAILERVIYAKKNRDINSVWNKVRASIGVGITLLLLLISYFITDTNIGMIYVFIFIFIYPLIWVIDDRSNIDWVKNAFNLLGFPFMMIFIIVFFKHSLINPQYITIFSLIMGSILKHGYENKGIGSIKENKYLIAGILISALLIFSYYKSTDPETNLKLKTVGVAEKFLEEELDIRDTLVYPDYNGGLRGKPIELSSYDEKRKTTIIMIYKNSKIISYRTLKY